MARVDIPIQLIPKNGSLDDIAFTAADAANDHSFINDANDILLVMKNDDAGGHTATVVSTPDTQNRLGDQTLTASAGEMSVGGPYTKSVWNQSDGTISVDIAADTSLFFAAVKFSKLA